MLGALSVDAYAINRKRTICALNEVVNMTTDGSWTGVGVAEEPASDSSHPEAKYIWSSNDPQPGQSATFNKTFEVSKGSLLLEQGSKLTVDSGAFRLYLNDQLIVDTIATPLASDTIPIPGGCFKEGTNALRLEGVIPMDATSRGVQALSARKGASRTICGSYVVFKNGRYIRYYFSDYSWSMPTYVPPPQIILSASFERKTLHPLKDHEGKNLGDMDIKKALDRYADRCKLTIGSTLNNFPYAWTVHLNASVINKSGGHDHDDPDSGRPTGAFSLTADGPWQTGLDVPIDSTGQKQIWYRCSGFGGEDLVTLSANQATTLHVSEPVKFDLIKFGEDGADTELIHFKGRTDDHQLNHYCSPSAATKINLIASKWQDWLKDPMHSQEWLDWATEYNLTASPSRKINPNDTRLYIDDQSLSFGGPFELGPKAKVTPALPSFWVIKRAHENHRQGISTDTPIRIPALEKIIRNNASGLLVEGGKMPHWHITVLN